VFPPCRLLFTSLSAYRLRVGIHSGPVTAGVLRGERSRFQLFGDTMNTASRMESTGVKGRIQCSQDTADLLIAAGKERWLEPRQDYVKVKGGLQTYWLNTSGSNACVEFDMIGGAPPLFDGLPQDKGRRLINWNVDNLLQLLKQIAATRRSKPGKRASKVAFDEKKVMSEQSEPGKSVIDEVKEIINLPDYTARNKSDTTNMESVVLPQPVVDQLREYVTNVAASYNANPFHNFEHASHVAMAVSKLLSRIVAPSDIDPDDSTAELGKALHDHTYGITSDPLTQFACVFSALIHDGTCPAATNRYKTRRTRLTHHRPSFPFERAVDHLGVPNAQLVKEKADVAERYRNQSVAEQNSVDLAWSLLMEPAYADLRRAIYSTPAEMQRFRQLVVNSVMATDIVDQNLKALRNARWAKAFSDESALDGFGGESEASCTNRKATIVIEHVIQAADVSHTMQHWHVYRKWNERFFEECYKAYIEERAEADPSVGWYKGELGFYDFYIIPLAKKLKDCGVFGVSSDECLNYAVRNRKEWEEKGQSIVGEMIERIRQQYPFVSKQVEL
jgi:3'5'-cyclic nucleotide phosphodiesterase/Adenylate and Guanylate cyclase catalytic domain